jgi:hypothetical protein
MPELVLAANPYPAGCERYIRAGDWQHDYEAAAIMLAVEARRMDLLAWCAKMAELFPQGVEQDPRLAAIAGICDRWFLFTVLLHREDALRHGEGSRWLYQRCREVEAEPDNCIDLWARDHYKSSIITFAGTVAEILNDPEICVGIFSHTRPIAKQFLRQIKQEFERNEDLKRSYHDVLWADPKEAPKWSEDEGIVVRRKSNPKEQTVEAWGLVDGQPTSKHFPLRVYDDVVTRENVTTPEQVKKTTEAYELSQNLGTRHGRRRIIGTRYSYADTYQVIIDRRTMKVRLHPATHDGTMVGRPVFLSEEEWAQKKRDQPSQIAAQFLQNPAAGQDSSFKAEWLASYEVRPLVLNVYILVDPSKGSPNRRSDRTAIAVIGVDTRGNRFLLDGYCHRMKLNERWERIKQLKAKWETSPGVANVMVGYERYGMQTDLEAIEWRMQQENVVFGIEELSTPRDHTRSKVDRVERLQPDFANGRFYLPMVVTDGAGNLEAWLVEDKDGIYRVEYRPLRGPTRAQRSAKDEGMGELVIGPIKRLDENGKVYDLTREFISEYLTFPFSVHDDLIDSASRIYDIGATAPMMVQAEDLQPEVYSDS